MNDRNCNMCVFHLTGSCSRWDCEGTITETMVAGLLEKAKKCKRCHKIVLGEENYCTSCGGSLK